MKTALEGGKHSLVASCLDNAKPLLELLWQLSTFEPVYNKAVNAAEIQE